MTEKELESLIDKAYNYLWETSSVFRNLSMDEQGRISMILAEEMKRSKNV